MRQHAAVLLFALLSLAAAWLFGNFDNPGKLLRAAWHRHTSFPAIDLYQDWSAGRDFLLGDSIYRPQRETFARHRPHLGFEPSAEPILEVNAHPPTLVLLVLPLATLDYATAFRVWSLLGLLFLGASTALLLRQLRPDLRGTRLLLLALAGSAVLTTALPIYRQFLFGNVQMLLLMCLTGAWAAARSGRSWLAGTCVGVATAVKLYPGLLGLYFLLRGDVRAALATAATVVGLGLAAGTVFGFDAYREFVQLGVPAAASYGGTLPNASLHGFARKLFAASDREGRFVELLHSEALAWVVIALGCAALLALFVHASRRARSPAQADIALAVAVVVMLLAAPVTWEHGQSLLLLPLAILWARAPARRLGLGLVTLAVWLNWRSTIEWRLHEHQDPPVYALWETLTWVSVRFYAMVALLCLAMRALVATFTDPGTAPPPSPRTDPSRDRSAPAGAGRGAAG